MKSTTLYLIRHGETEWNRNRRVQGHHDVPLNETGVEQALQLASELRDIEFDAVYASPFIRAYNTAKPLSQKIQTDERLKEISYGIYDGILWNDPRLQAKIKERKMLGKTDNWHYQFDGTGESPFEVFSRAIECLDELVLRHPEQKIAVVTHGGLIRSVISKIADIDLHHIEVDNIGYVVLNANETQYSPIQYCRIKLMKGIV